MSLFMQITATFLGVAAEILIWVVFGADRVVQFAGVFYMLGAAVGAVIGLDTSAAASCAALGWMFWFMGNLTYYGSYGVCRSRVAEILLELLASPRARQPSHPRYHSDS
jgi:hypothetical protein